MPAEALDYSSLDDTEYAEFIESVQTKPLSSAHRHNYEGALVGLQWYSVTLHTIRILGLIAMEADENDKRLSWLQKETCGEKSKAIKIKYDSNVEGEAWESRQHFLLTLD